MAGCEVRRQRRSGPGGQHRNKVETAVVITHEKSGITGEASERRSQEENRQSAIFRLRLNLALAVRRATGTSTPASSLWKSRCVAGKISVNPQHQDFPALLAESLDVLAAQQMDVKAAAEQLDCTTSQLVKFLQREPRAFALVNAQRQASGLRPLK